MFLRFPGGDQLWVQPLLCTSSCRAEAAEAPSQWLGKAGAECRLLWSGAKLELFQRALCRNLGQDGSKEENLGVKGDRPTLLLLPQANDRGAWCCWAQPKPQIPTPCPVFRGQLIPPSSWNNLCPCLTLLTAEEQELETRWQSHLNQINIVNMQRKWLAGSKQERRSRVVIGLGCSSQHHTQPALLAEALLVQI